jgi:hypothetical protein
MMETLTNAAFAIPAVLGEATAIKPAVPATDLGWAGLILLFPAVSAVLCGICAAMRVKGKLPGVITAVSLLASFATTLALFLNFPADGPRTVHLFDWVSMAWSGQGATWSRCVGACPQTSRICSNGANPAHASPSRGVPEVFAFCMPRANLRVRACACMCVCVCLYVRVSQAAR